MFRIILLGLIFLWWVLELALLQFRHEPYPKTFQLQWLHVVVFVSIFLGMFFSNTSIGQISIRGAWVGGVLGMLIMMGGIGLRLWALYTRYHRKRDELLVTPPYDKIRHPAYAGLLLTAIGLGVGFWNYIALVLLVAPLIFMTDQRVQQEEKELLGHFGEDYQAYAEKTDALFPEKYLKKEWKRFRRNHFS